MQRVGLLNWDNITYDKDFTAGLLASLTAGVISWFGITGSGAGASIQAGKALIECTRSNGEKILVFFENTTDVATDMSGTKKVYILVNQAKIDDGSGNAEDGTGIASIQTGASYPAGNYIPLYSIASGTPTDARPAIKSLLKRKGFTAYRLLLVDANGDETELAFGANGTVLVSWGASAIPWRESPTVNINSLTEKTSVVADDLFVISDSEDSNVNKKISYDNILQKIDSSVSKWLLLAGIAPTANPNEWTNYTITIPIWQNFKTLLFGIGLYSRYGYSPALWPSIGAFGYWEVWTSWFKFKAISYSSSNSPTAPSESFSWWNRDNSPLMTTIPTQSYGSNYSQIVWVVKSWTDLLITIKQKSDYSDRKYAITSIMVIN